MQNANKKKITGAVALAAAGVMALGGVSMLFTDHADVSGKATAGKLAVEVTGTGLADGDFSAQLKNNDFATKGIDCANPGDTFQISYSINNAANKAVRANDTLTVTVTPDEAMMADQTKTIADLYGEFADKSAIHLVTGAKGDTKQVVTASDGTTTDVTFGDTGLTLVDSHPSEDGKSIVLVYQGDETALDGVGDNAEKLGDNKSTSDRQYTLYFNKDAGNEWQGAKVSIGSTISAVQYANTSTGDATLNVSKEDHTVATNAGKNSVEIAQEKVKTDEHGKTIGG